MIIDLNQAGKYIFFFGIILALAGAVLWFFGNKLNWFGNLPGDVKMEKENFKFYFPVTTMILVSIALTLLLWVVRKFMK